MWYHKHFPDKSDLILRNECIHYLMNELEYKMNLIIENYPIKIMYPLLFLLKNNINYPVLENKNKLYNIIINNKELHNVFLNDIYYKDTVLEKMEELRKMDNKSSNYNLLYQNIIKVGEFSI